MTVETIAETTKFRSGKDIWDWIVSSNPIVERVLGGILKLTDHERDVVRRTLDTMVRERVGSSGVATLTNPINIGIGTK